MFESEKSIVPHKTMHLTINQGMGTIWNLIWEPYEGFAVNTYNIYRGTAPNNLVLIGSTSGSSTQYTDNTAPSGYVYYQIQVVNPNSCNPSKSYSVSTSNIATNDPLVGICAISSLENIKIYPNPSNGLVNIAFAESTKGNQLDVINSFGQVILTKQINTSTTTLDLTNKAKGMYFIKVQSGNGVAVRKVIIE